MADDRAGQIREAVRRLPLAPPRHRLISSSIGREIASAGDIADLLCADLDCPATQDRALHLGAAHSILLHETWPGQVLIDAASVLCQVPGVSLGAGSGADAARAAAALFAAGALEHPGRFYAGTPSRPMDIWRDHAFITSPCQAVPPGPAPRSAARGAAGSAQAPARDADVPAAAPLAAPAAPLAAAAAAAQRAVAAGWAATSGQMPAARPTASAGPSAPAADSTRPDPPAPPAVAGVAPWIRCYVEELRPAGDAAPPPDDQAWRVRAATQKAFGPLVRELFRDDPAAGLALVLPTGG